MQLSDKKLHSSYALNDSSLFEHFYRSKLQNPIQNGVRNQYNFRPIIFQENSMHTHGTSLYWITWFFVCLAWWLFPVSNDWKEFIHIWILDSPESILNQKIYIT